MRPVLVCFSISVLLNGVVLGSLDRVFVHEQAQMAVRQKEALRQKNENIQFEFVESPPKTHPEKPPQTKKISNRDTLAQNIAPRPAQRPLSPKTKLIGAADQLAQRKGAPSSSAPARTDPKPSTDAQRQKAFSERETKPTPPPAPQKDEKAPPGLTGQDKINTQEISKRRSPGARLYGVTSFDAMGSTMGGYVKNMKEKIWLAWFPYIAFQYPQEFKGADAVLIFTLNAKGEVKSVKIADSRGGAVFASVCAESVQRASGFGDVPQEVMDLLGGKDLEVRFAFHYH